MPIRGGFPGAPNVIACFTEPSSVGSPYDIDAPRNAPVKDPGNYMSYIQWHSDFFQYELAFPIQTVTINHPALAGASKFWGPSQQYYMFDITYTSSISYRVPGQTAYNSYTLFTHNLGYPPLAFVAYGGQMLMPGVAVEIASQGRSRFVSAYVTNTTVGLREVYNSSENDLAAISQTYQVMVFSVPAQNASLPLMSQDAVKTTLARGKISTNKNYLKRGTPTGSSPFNIDKGPTIDISQGRTKIVTGGVTTVESGYAGSFTGPAFVNVGV